MTLQGSGSTWSQGAAITSSAQLAQDVSNPLSSQMVGFTQYTANVAPTILPNGQTVSQVHVYVENAVAQAGHVHHA